MRIKINFTKNITPVKNNNLPDIMYYIHTKCLGKNNKYHGSKNKDYSISQLYGGKLDIVNNVLNFNNGSYIIISSQNEEFLRNIIKNIYNENCNELFNGMMFDKIDYVFEDFYNGWNYFSTLSPFIIKKRGEIKEGESKFYTLNDNNFSEIVTEHTKNKLSKINSNLKLNDFKITINNHPKHKVKKVEYNNIKNQANQCQINIFCNKNVAELIYNLGIGQSTGCGFGTIYKTENHSKYRI